MLVPTGSRIVDYGWALQPPQKACCCSNKSVCLHRPSSRPNGCRSKKERTHRLWGRETKACQSSVPPPNYRSALGPLHNMHEQSGSHLRYPVLVLLTSLHFQIVAI